MSKKEKFDPFPNDTILREYGFQIAARPLHGEAIWVRNGQWISEKKALETINQTIVPQEE